MDDFIIIGAGSAGAVLANRLSDSATVTLVEAGPADHRWDYRLHMPAALSHVLASRLYNWHFESAAEPGLDNRRLYCPRGKVLGGSSAINGMIFVRGHPADFDRWAKSYGLTDWDYASCLPYFKQSESVQFTASAVRGTGGLQPVTRAHQASPLVSAWLQAGNQAGHPTSADFNGESQEGIGMFDRSLVNGTRQSTSRSYLDPVADRQALTILKSARVTRILFDNGHARGIEYVANGSVQRRYGGEIIVSAGAIGSPHLLMLSGIGPREMLSTRNIPIVHNLPGVGQNLQDHLEIYVQYACLQPVSLYPALQWYRMPGIGLQWLLARSGIGASNHFESGAFLKSSSAAGYPDLQYHFLPVAMNYDGKSHHKGHGFQFHVGPMKPTSRGSISLRSSNPAEHPVIQFNYNTTPEDRRVMREGIRLGHEIIEQPAFDPFRGERIRPAALDDASLDAFVRSHAESAYHPCGTCRMGVDDNAVVNDAGQVRGTTGLRVVDASIMPEITNGNLNAPVIMMAEKIAAAMLSG